MEERNVPYFTGKIRSKNVSLELLDVPIWNLRTGNTVEGRGERLGVSE